MAANSNVQAVAFANNKIRPMATQIYAMYINALSVLEQYNTQGISSVIPNDSNLLVDGSATDGRPPMTDAQAINIINRCQDIVNWCQGSNAISAGSGSAVLTSIAAVQVNGTGTL